MKYNCKRCSYKTENKGDLIRHLQKLKICQAIKEDGLIEKQTNVQC